MGCVSHEHAVDECESANCSEKRRGGASSFPLQNACHSLHQVGGLGGQQLAQGPQAQVLLREEGGGEAHRQVLCAADGLLANVAKRLNMLLFRAIHSGLIQTACRPRKHCQPRKQWRKVLVESTGGASTLRVGELLVILLCDALHRGRNGAGL